MNVLSIKWNMIFVKAALPFHNYIEMEPIHVNVWKCIENFKMYQILEILGKVHDMVFYLQKK